MKRPLKITLAAVGGLFALLLVALGVFIATFDPNAYKPLLVDTVKERWQRTLAIPGPIGLTIFPRLGVKVGAVTLSERGSSERFASIDSAEVAVALWPLVLRREVVASRVALAGGHVRIVRFKDGKLSIDDLLVAPAPAGSAAGAASAGAPAAGASSPSASTPLALDIAGVALTDAELTFDDRKAPRRVVVSKLAVQTGHIAPGLPVAWSAKGRIDIDAPKLGSDLALQGKLLLGPAPGRIALEGLQAELDAKLDALVLKAKLTGDIEGDTERQRYSAKAFNITLDGRQGATPLSAKLALTFTAGLQTSTLSVPKLELEAALPNPKGGNAAPLALTAAGSMALEFGSAQRLDAKLTGQFDQSRFSAALGMPRLAPASYTFDVEIDKLDVDRYRAARPASAAPASTPAAAEKPLDLSALGGLEASGQVRIGALQVMNLKSTQMRAGVRASGGRLSFSPMAAEFYQGHLAGSASVTAAAAGAAPRFTLQPTLTGVAIGPLLKDLIGNERVLGRGDVALDVQAAGATAGAIMKSLAGEARVQLKDGALRGINIAQAIRRAKAAARGGGDGTAAKDESTDFSELGASFRIAGGVAHNEDLALKSPLLRIGGAGDIDIAANRLDYLVRATVVSTLKGQGGAELEALSGQTIPVKLTGPFDAITWKIDFAGMFKEELRSRVDDKKEAVKEEARRRLGEQLRGILKK